MDGIRIDRTAALRHFLSEVGNPVKGLNTIVVGLNAVAAGIARKPQDLAVSWDPQDLARAESEARTLAIRSLVVLVCDALENYLFEVAEEPSPLRDQRLISVLRGQPQYRSFTPPRQIDIDGLAKALTAGAADSQTIRKEIRGFQNRVYGDSESSTLRTRLQSLDAHCRALAGHGRNPSPPKASYAGAAELLVAWRNELVHKRAQGTVQEDALARLRSDSEQLARDHADIDVGLMILHYKAGNAPTLKEVSTLCSILIRYIRAIDAVLIANTDLVAFLRKAIIYEISRNGIAKNVLRNWTNLDRPKRLSKIQQLVNGHGFVPSSFDSKKQAYKGSTLHCDDLNFLDADLSDLKTQTQ